MKRRCSERGAGLDGGRLCKPVQEDTQMQVLKTPKTYSFVNDTNDTIAFKLQPPPKYMPQPHLHPQPQSHPQPKLTSSPNPKLTSSPQPTSPILDVDSLFTDTVRKVQELEATTKQAILFHDRERRKWRNHCLTFKQERDLARRQVVLLMQERVRMLAGRREAGEGLVEMEGRREVEVEVETEAVGRREGREGRRHSPYLRARRASSVVGGGAKMGGESPPGSDSSSGASTVSATTTTTTTNFLEAVLNKRSSSSPPTLVHEPSAVLTASPDGAPDERIVIDSEEVDVEPRITSAPLFDLGERFDGEADRGISDGGYIEGLELDLRALGPHHLEFMYLPAHNKLWCRMCLFKRSEAMVGDVVGNDQDKDKDKDAAGAIPGACSFSAEASWEELKKHGMEMHPVECRRIVDLSPRCFSEFRNALGLPLQSPGPPSPSES